MSLSAKAEATRAKFDSARRLRYEEAAASLKYKALLTNIYQHELLRERFLELPYDADAEDFMTFCFQVCQVRFCLSVRSSVCVNSNSPSARTPPW
jgi:hypothetical protein